MSVLTLTVKAPFIDRASEEYLQTILPEYESKTEVDGVIELRRTGYRRVTVTAEAVLNAVLLDEVTGRVMPGTEAIAKAKADSAKKIARAIAPQLRNVPNYYLPTIMQGAARIEALCTQAL